MTIDEYRCLEYTPGKFYYAGELWVEVIEVLKDYDEVLKYFEGLKEHNSHTYRTCRELLRKRFPNALLEEI